MAEESAAPTHNADTDPTRPKRITTEQFYEALVSAGVLRRGEAIRRVVIDAEAGRLVHIYVDRLADERLVRVALTLEGVEITQVPA